MPSNASHLPPLPRHAAHPRRRFASLRTIFALVLREMATTYGRSPGGYLWAVLEPVAGITLLTLVFSAGFRSPGLGVNFPLFYATGLVPFNLFSSISGRLAGSLQFSRPLLTYPAVSFLDAIIARFVVNMMTQILVAYLLFTSIMLMYDTRVDPDYWIVVEGFFYAGLMAMGVGTINCYLFTAYPVWQQIWAIVMRPMFILSCIFFVFESVPEPFRSYLWYNPLVHIVGIVRRGFYSNYDATYVSIPYLTLLPLILFALGLILLRRYHRDLLDR
ncbi:capsular polysaccharide transport system permease protein [Poseidonocella pacifica]|uniref:Transport permease protein n=1 Tax=Poseidonocella pacifica TaxID=871651 RepID=A0A1I0V6B0_9RHOB|nr:ABC transporter permease [Poseidonocella pacifica]SFA71869.1 capsular polysaccharide transport system permease protein [Poseidonocella pacifica]